MPQVPPSSKPCPAHWFQSTACQRVLALEQRAMTPLLTAHAGVRGLFLRASASCPGELSGNMLQHVCRLYPREGQLGGDFDCQSERLPLASESLSLVYVQHALEQCQDWPDLLEEVARCLQPEGVLMLTVFSRFSLWRSRWQGLLPIDRSRVLRCCESAGLVIEERRPIGPLWPLPLGESLHGLQFAPCRTSWALVARKRRAGMTAVGARRNVVFKPTARPT
ncbi:class I SAM-dependent methyltransferase [Pseudomarimonas arenosa]|uniref:Methyltransferase domain-containing protein n=1 Tax=Pseudomarimonas arenosa TaxID=2774145 RepID=A0AAW3ZMC7_9GAMM|nr:methyltransferase domain-containing protein [Pseudomarimonas arenosa]MBD8526045.1 methyltransferase domain-containing protein [Pseudomarimonas arenosa]